MKKIILALALIVFPAVAPAADQALERPHWSFEIKGGLFYPDIPDWKTYYGSDRTTQYGAALAYKATRRIEFGIEGGYVKDTGRGFAPGHGRPAGQVTYELFPVNLFVLFRGVVSENQWLVPYAGGGFTRMYYREKVEFQDTIKGHADGYHARAGLQFLLDGLDRSAANNFYLDSGVYHTYLFTEAQYSRVMVNATSGSVNLGGMGYLAGLLFEF
jgi:hypothetical protein